MIEEAQVDRRGFLRKLVGRSAGVAAGAGAASALLANGAGAAEGGNIVIGATGDANNVGTTTTTLTGSQFNVVSGNGNASMSAQHALTGSFPGAVAVQAVAPHGAGVIIIPDGGTVPMPPTGTTGWQAGSLRVDGNSSEANVWFCYADGIGAASGWYPLSLIPAFVPLVAPQRIYYSAQDPTYGFGPILNGQERDISSLTGGFVPATAFAISINLAVISTAGNTGFLAVFGADVAWPGHSNINWFGANQILANGTVTATDVAGDFTVRCGTNGSTHFVVDVLGFYTLTA